MNHFKAISMCFMVLLVWMTPAFTSAEEEGVEKLRMLMENTTPEQRAGFEDRWMQEALHLNKDQAARIREINLQTAKRMQAIYNSDDGRFRKFRQIMQTREEKDKELRVVLTEDQMDQYQTKKDEMWDKMHEIRR